MSKKNNGGSAFPHGPNAQHFERAGMDLRDFFAAQAMQALVGRFHQHPHTFSELVAEQAYQYADAMLAERQK